MASDKEHVEAYNQGLADGLAGRSSSPPIPDPTNALVGGIVGGPIGLLVGLGCTDTGATEAYEKGYEAGKDKK